MLLTFELFVILTFIAMSAFGVAVVDCGLWKTLHCYNMQVLITLFQTRQAEVCKLQSSWKLLILSAGKSKLFTHVAVGIV